MMKDYKFQFQNTLQFYCRTSYFQPKFALNLSVCVMIRFHSSWSRVATSRLLPKIFCKERISNIYSISESVFNQRKSPANTAGQDVKVRIQPELVQYKKYKRKKYKT